MPKSWLKLTPFLWGDNMLLKEMNFRDIVDKYLYIEAAGVAQKLGSIFEVTDDAADLLQTELDTC